jgi:serine/threonine-protein kinase
VPGESGELPPAARRSRRVALASGLVVGVGAVLVWLATHSGSPAPAEPVAAAPALPRPAITQPVTADPAPAPAPAVAAAPTEGPAVVPAPAADVPSAVVAAPARAPEPKSAPVKAAAPARPAAPAKEARPARDVRVAAASPAANMGSVRIAVSPWGSVEVDGTPVGTTPPLNELSLPEGRHQVTIRNADFPPFVTTVTVVPGQSVNLRHKFGS